MNNDIILNELVHLIAGLKSCEDVRDFLTEMLSESELSLLSKRWRILKMLAEGCTQRDIASELGVSLCKVTRGAKILKNSDAVVTKYLMKEKNNEYRFKK